MPGNAAHFLRPWTRRDLQRMRRSYATTPDLDAFARSLGRSRRAVEQCAVRLRLKRAHEISMAGKLKGVQAMLVARGVADRSIVGLAMRSLPELQRVWSQR